MRKIKLLIPTTPTNYKTNSSFFSHCKSPPPFPKNPNRAHMASTTTAPTTTTAPAAARRHKKIIVIMGPTGCGKSKLSVDLASRHFPSSEIINSDKIQIYRGLDVTSNKTPPPDRKNVPHHLLGDFVPTDSHPEFTAADFRSAAAAAVSQVASRRKTPFLVGGSNSYIYALLAKRFTPDAVSGLFAEPGPGPFCKELRYSCCFIWVDVAPPVLNEYLGRRVDEMMGSGMLEELAEYFDSDGPGSGSKSGLRKTIGVPEFESYFERYGVDGGKSGDDVERKRAYDAAVSAVKENSCQLAKRQLGKIVRLRDVAGWDLKRVDATAALRAAMDGGDRKRAAEVWEKEVVEPSVEIVKRFLME